MKKIHRLLFHVVAHLYHAHFREVVLLSLHAHLNCVFAHFVLFNEKFRLVDDKETEILHDLVLALKIHPETAHGAPLTPTDVAPSDRGSSPIGIPAAAESHAGGSPAAPLREDGGCFSGHSSSPGGLSSGEVLPLASFGGGDAGAETAVPTSATAVFDSRVSLTDTLP